MLPAEPPPVGAQALLCGKYRLISLLGQGGMGVVWRAQDVRLSAPVAIKLLHHGEVSNPELRERFEAEAKIAASLSSPHIVHVFDVGWDEDHDVPFLAMELLDGETLSDRLRRGMLTPAHAAQVVSQVARGLTRAHERHVTHRDLKPSNIFLVRNADAELAKLLDFGIAKRSSASRREGPTGTGDLLGTPIYMSPEQITSSRDVDYRSDLWSLAVIAVECLTGRIPFEADNLPALALQICHGQAAPPSTLGVVPEGFDRWFRRATSLDPEGRFGSAAEMAEELRRICGAADAATMRQGGEQEQQRYDSGEDASGSAPPPSEIVNPSVGALSRTSPLAAPLARQRWRTARRQRWALAVLGIPLLVATCAWLQERPASVGTPSATAALAPHVVDDGDRAVDVVEKSLRSAAPEPASGVPRAPPASAPDVAELEPKASAPTATQKRWVVRRKPKPARTGSTKPSASASSRLPSEGGSERQPESGHSSEPSVNGFNIP